MYNDNKKDASMKEMVDAVRQLHLKNDFAATGGEDMQFRLLLMIEELGEIASCLTKGTSGIAEEHADLLILLLGNCIALGIDIEKEFWRKLVIIMERPAITVAGHKRITSKDIS